MERYALNETTLAGFAVLYGNGTAGQALAAQGAPHLVMHPVAQVAGIGLAAQGSGLVAVLGEGVADIAMTAAARAYLLVCAVADMAFMALSALADGHVIPAARGVAAMTMSAVGCGIKAALGSGAAWLALDIRGKATMATNGDGSADMQMTASAGIPHPMAAPGTFTAAHPSRVVRVANGGNAFTVAAQARTIRVAQQDRIIHVAQEGGQ